MKNMYPCIWLGEHYDEACQHYPKIFSNSLVLNQNKYATQLTILGSKICLLAGNRSHPPNASIAFALLFDNEDELRVQWDSLSEGGIVLMPLASYPWSSSYGWVRDRYGITWILSTHALQEGDQRLIPQFSFLHNNYGKAAEAIKFYTEIFPQSEVLSILHYKGGIEEDGTNASMIQHAAFQLDGYTLFIIDSNLPHPFQFNEGISIVKECNNQEAIDYYWNALIADGGVEQSCGWLKDKYGVSWQIIPHNIAELMSDADFAQRMMQMKKIIIP